MSFLKQLKLKKSNLKSTVTKITHADGTQEQLILSESGNESKVVHLTPKTYGFIVDTKPDFEPACILDEFLYLGSQDSVILKNVEKYQLTDILSIGIETPQSDIIYGDGTDSTVRTHFVECLDLPETQLKHILKRTNGIIQRVRENNGRMLVHCNAGVSRSSTVCIAYLMTFLKLSFDSAFRLVKSKRECIRPNDGFLNQLKQLDSNSSSGTEVQFVNKSHQELSKAVE